MPHLLSFCFKLNCATVRDAVTRFCVCVHCCAAPGAVGPFHEDECRAAPQAERDADAAEEHRGEEGRRGDRPEGEEQRDREAPNTAQQCQRKQPCM